MVKYSQHFVGISLQLVFIFSLSLHFSVSLFRLLHVICVYYFKNNVFMWHCRINYENECLQMLEHTKVCSALQIFIIIQLVLGRLRSWMCFWILKRKTQPKITIETMLRIVLLFWVLSQTIFVHFRRWRHGNASE